MAPRSGGRIVSTLGFPIVLRFDRNQHGRLENDDLYNLFTTEAPYTQELDYVGGKDVIYLGRAAPGSDVLQSSPVWQIRRFDYITVDPGPPAVTAVLKVLWANGTAKFNQVWTGRAALAYS